MMYKYLRYFVEAVLLIFAEMNSVEAIFDLIIDARGHAR